jgi:hypothetical protein
MSHFAVNWLAVVVAMVASMALGFVWYMALSKQWLAALGKKPEDINRADLTPYAWSVVVQLVMAYFVALLTPAIFGATNVTNGILCASTCGWGS